MQNDILFKTVDFDTLIEEFKYNVSKGFITADDLTQMFKDIPQESLETIDTAIAYALVHRERE